MHLLDGCERCATWLILIGLCASCDSSRRDAAPRVEPAIVAGESRQADELDGPGIPDTRPAPDAPALADPDAAGDRSPEERSTPVRITEIHYHAAASAAGSEFIEILNAGPERISLGGWKLSGGVKFAFPPGAALEPGAITVIARSAATLRQVFGDGLPLAGEYSGRLDNAGELVRLEDAAGRAVSDVRYSDLAPWPPAADGEGPSLQRISLERDVDDPGNWAAESPTPGSRGAARPRARLSIFDVRHVPERPAPDRSVRVTAAVFHPSPAAELSLHFSGGDPERAVPMERVSTRALAAGGHESRFAAVVPPRPASTVIRYWLAARGSAGDVERSPPEGAPPSSHAYFVEDSTVETSLPVYHLFIEPRSLTRLLRNPRSDELFPATFAHAGRVHADVQVRLRGSWARSWPKKSWKIFFPKGARLSKRDRINLNSCWRDAAYIRESMAYEIYEQCGALSLRAKMVRLHINGQFWGLFVDVEQPREAYLSRVGIPGAALYKASSSRNQSDERLFGSPAEYASHYESETQPDGTFEELHDFCRELASSRDVRGFFETRLDLPRYIDYLCASTLTQNWDAFNKNHFIARDREGSGKWYVIPWDVDRTLGDHWSWSFTSTDLPLLLGTRMNQGATGWNRLVDRFFSDPTLKARYMDRLRELLESEFTEEKLLPLVDRLAASIATEADLDRSRWGGEGDWREAVDEVRSFIRKRRKFVLSELSRGAPERARKPSHGR